MSNKSIMMSQKKLMIRIITTPYKAICKARDLYIKSITSCANHATYGGSSAIAFGTQFPRSTSSSSFGSSDEDLRELIRANSTANNIINRADLDLYIKQQMMMLKQQSSSPAMSSRRVPRSASVGMGRIDEDAPVCSFSDFDDDEDHIHMGSSSRRRRKVKSDHFIFPRSKSHAVTTSTNIAAAKINRFS